MCRPSRSRGGYEARVEKSNRRDIDGLAIKSRRHHEPWLMPPSEGKPAIDLSSFINVENRTSAPAQGERRGEAVSAIGGLKLMAKWRSRARKALARPAALLVTARWAPLGDGHGRTSSLGVPSMYYRG